MAHCPRQPQKITGGPVVWPAWSARSPWREPCWYRGVAVDAGGTVPTEPGDEGDGSEQASYFAHRMSAGSVARP